MTTMYNDMTYRQWLVGQFADKLAYITGASSHDADDERREMQQKAIDRYLDFIDAIIDTEEETAAPRDDLQPDVMESFARLLELYGIPQAAVDYAAMTITPFINGAMIPYENIANVQKQMLKLYGINVGLASNVEQEQ